MTKNLLPLLLLLGSLPPQTVAAESPVPIRAFASSPEPGARFHAANTIDGDMATRWSSDHGEPHWIAFDFGETVPLNGVRLHWETAYGRDYDIELSDDGEQWNTVYTWRDGSGGIDDVYFGPREARFLRLVGLRRGTGWGFSLFEVEFPGPDNLRRITASEPGLAQPPESIMDGDPATSWSVQRTSGTPAPRLDVRFPEPLAFGGLSIDWAEGVGTPWRLYTLSREGADWQPIASSSGRQSPEDFYLDQMEALAIRIELELPDGGYAAIAEIAMKGPDDTWNPLRHKEMLAKRLPVGTFPWWLLREQGFFTVVGQPQSDHVTLIDEDGRIEPRKDAFSVTPLLLVDGEVLTARDFETTQSLAEGWAPIPRVQWSGHDLGLEIEAVDTTATLTDVVYTLSNQGTDPFEGALLLTVNPLQVNPPWQRGGFSPITEALWDDGANTLVVNGAPALRLQPAPQMGGVLGRSDDHISELLRDGTGWVHRASDEDGLVSAGWRYDTSLAPGESLRVLVRYSLDGSPPEKIESDTAEYLAAIRAASLDRWHAATGDWSLVGSDPIFAAFVRSNLAYLLINAQGPAIQPGTRNYQHSWIRDGSISATAMIAFGMVEPVREYVEWLTALVRPDGFVPFLVEATTGEMASWTGDWKEYDSFGQFVYLVREYVDYAGDDEFLKRAWPKVEAVMDKVTALRQERIGEQWSGTVFEGILPESNSHEGYFPAVHSYWDVFFALRGYEDAAALAEKLGHSEDAAHFTSAGEDLRAAFLTSIDRVRSKHNLSTIPASADLGDFDPTSTSIGIMLGDERDHLPADALLATYDRYIAEAKKRAQGGEFASSYTAYEGRNVSALLRMNRRDDARWLLDWLMEDAIRPRGWNHMGEVTHPDPRQPAYIGDMPHTWVGSGMIHAIRDLFVYEERDELILAAGLTEDEIERSVTIAGWSTRYGLLGYRLENVDGIGTVLDLDLEARPGLVVVLPEGITLRHRGKEEHPFELRHRSFNSHSR